MQYAFSIAQKRFYRDLITLQYGGRYFPDRELWNYFDSYISVFEMLEVFGMIVKMQSEKEKTTNLPSSAIAVAVLMTYQVKNKPEIRAYLTELFKAKPKHAVKAFEIAIKYFGMPLPNSLKRVLRSVLETYGEKKLIKYINKKPYKKKFLSDVINLTHPKLHFETNEFFQLLNNKKANKKWKVYLTQEYQKEGSYQHKRSIKTKTWKAILGQHKASANELLEHLDIIFKHAPQYLPKAFEQIKESDLENTSPIDVLQTHQQIQKAYVKRMHRILHSKEFVESIILEQENEIHRLQVASKRIFRKWEDELFFGGYHRLMHVFHQLEHQQKDFFKQIHQLHPQEATQKMSVIVKREEEIRQALQKFEQHYLNALPPSFEQEEGWRKIERQALKNLRRKVGFFHELGDIFYSQKATQIKKLYFYSPNEIQEVLREVAQHLEELEDTILYRIRGRIEAFKDIQKLYLEEARPSMQLALREMYEVALGVSRHMSDKLQEAQKNQAQQLRDLPEKETPPLLDEAIEENLAEKDKKKVKKGLKLEDFQSLYKEQVRETYWHKTNQNQKEELHQLRRKLRKELEEARKILENILQVTKENIAQTLKAARNELFSIYQQTAKEKNELAPFFEEIRGKVERIFERKSFAEDFLTLYPDLTRANDLEQYLLTDILPKTLGSFDRIKGKTLIVLDESLIYEGVALERASWLTSLIFNTSKNVEIKVLGSESLHQFYTQNFNKVAALQRHLQDSLMSYATSERGNWTLAFRQLKTSYDNIIFFSYWQDQSPRFPFRQLKIYRQERKTGASIFVLNMKSSANTKLLLQRNGVFICQGVYEKAVEWINEVE